MSATEDNLARQIAAIGIVAPQRQLRFAPPRRWRLDFAWPDLLCALEVEGVTGRGGRHQTAKGFRADIEKYAEATVRGWRLLRVTQHDVASGRALQWLEQLLALHRGITVRLEGEEEA